jgi:hypothetical protein
LKSTQSLARVDAKIPSCVDRKLEAQKRRRSLDVQWRVHVIEKANIIKHKEFKSNLNTATVSLTPFFGITSIGISLEVHNDKLVVMDVSNNGLAFYSGSIHRGFILEEVNGKKLNTADVDSIDAVVHEKITLKFLRPDPELPIRGCHRNLFKKKRQFKPEPRQIEFFNICYKKNPLVSSLDLFSAMKVEFGNDELRDDLTPMYFTKSYISNLIKDETRKQKESSKKSKLLLGPKSVVEGDSDDDHNNEAKPESGFDSDVMLSSDEEEGAAVDDDDEI